MVRQRIGKFAARTGRNAGPAARVVLSDSRGDQPGIVVVYSSLGGLCRAHLRRAEALPERHPSQPPDVPVLPYVSKEYLRGEQHL
ncbi:hypothetical protein MCAG_01408 [Micromonospora sp. ATCC 39149]|nr:hypothetical protein MCAG_01408 [Micromonospora sp. ATCC 39149]